jgi:GNAT superfamily N-acetyltransferase
MISANGSESDKPPSAENETAASTVSIGPATHADIDGIIELLYLRPPAFWMRKISIDHLRTFMGYAIKSPRSVLLLARSPGESVPAGYVFAVFDPRWFWIGFAVGNPPIACSIAFHRLLRLLALRREIRAQAGGVTAGLPAFSWSPSRPDAARIIGLYVRKEHRRKGIAMDLYFKLFDALKEKACAKVEEYMGPDYPQYAGTFPEVCGWRLQPCDSGGYKISKSLRSIYCAECQFYDECAAWCSQKLALRVK